jgi:sarcosine oxidase, subunit beta
MSNTADVIIIGAGVHGASLAFHLTGRGVRPIVLEKNFIGAGATGRSSGLVRMHYDVHQDSELAWVSFAYFKNWSEMVGGESGLPARVSSRSWPVRMKVHYRKIRPCIRTSASHPS